MFFSVLVSEDGEWLPIVTKKKCGFSGERSSVEAAFKKLSSADFTEVILTSI
jgi:hypothetical protein